jgi:predicted unusual protein kinase regulating ubiquinone biosynthesis (AarF/ABC1/UbiB family)
MLREDLDYSREVAHAKFFRDLFSNEPGFASAAARIDALARATM